jgi:hypothetical protein
MQIAGCKGSTDENPAYSSSVQLVFTLTYKSKSYHPAIMILHHASLIRFKGGLSILVMI